ncbi:YueI family protein [Bacillus sp. CECT 9360]|uniref:YueI family protein n=1 Tax=Bacillus sp. CECT 9360 TaxID=2845821 RepID=UPI001E4A569B|nr:YueI family protein [Bacillus sp. CECT 9360]CAH0344031.1 putative protein YueI [Bacillus sp. CECT 9360]
MTRVSVDDYLQEGIHGKKEIKPEERRKYLGTLRERVVAVLTQAQVREKTIYPEIDRLLKENPQATLLMNGSLNYSDIAKYIALAKDNKTAYKIVANSTHVTELGLVLACDTAIDKATISIDSRPKKAVEKKKKPSLFSKIIRRIKKKR